MLTDEDKGWIDGRLETLETKLLTAFHDWADPNDKRVRGYGMTISALEQEIANLRTRVAMLEAKQR